MNRIYDAVGGRKMFLTLFTILLALAHAYKFIDLDNQSFTAMLVAVGGFLGVEGIADIVGRAKQIDAVGGGSVTAPATPATGAQ